MQNNSGIDLKRCHFIGIGGIGMSGLAHLLIDKKSDISGSDIGSSPIIDQLQAKGAKVFVGHDNSQILPNTPVVVSSGIKDNNPEYQKACSLKCPILHRSDLLKILSEEKSSLAVAGSHGKTTTSSLLTWVLHSAQRDPSFAVGGMIPQLQTNAKNGKGDFFVLEADESDGTFMKYAPFGAIVTNIGLDHMDFYRNEETLCQSFKTFISQVQSENHLFVCGDDERLKKISRGVTYGFTQECDLVVTSYYQKEWRLFFDIDYQGKSYKKVEVSLTGKHNVLNALAVFGLCLSLGLTESEIRTGLKTFQGSGRRCEVKGESQQVLFIDDYAHHPTEIKTTLHGIKKAIGPRRLVCVFQPHRYSRTKECLGLYKELFDYADKLIITDIYAAGEDPLEGINAERVLEKANFDEAIYVPRDKIEDLLITFINPLDVVVTLGAGDITKVSSNILKKMETIILQKLKIALICGGRSVEHDISLQTAQFFQDALTGLPYDFEVFKIEKNGYWQNDSASKQASCLSSETVESLKKCDVVIPALHGTYGEDGTLQGFCEILDIPYIGPCHRSCALAMDKGLTKSLLKAHGVQTADFVDISESDLKKEERFCQIEKKIGYPAFVKPSHLGSSIGVERVTNRSELLNALKVAFKIDTRAVVEKEIEGRELEFAVLGSDDPEVLNPGEIEKQGQFYHFDVKYGEQSLPINMKIDLSSEKISEGKALAHKVYQILGLSGFSRIDFFLDHTQQFFVNEVNPIPGFTKNSFYPLVLQEHKISKSDFVKQQILFAFERHRKHKKRCSL